MNENDIYGYDEGTDFNRKKDFKLSTKKIKKLWNHSKKYGSKNEQLQYQEMYQESIKH